MDNKNTEEGSFDLKQFKLTKVLGYDHLEKRVSLVGTLGDDQEKQVLIGLFKDTFDTEDDFEAAFAQICEEDFQHKVLSQTLKKPIKTLFDVTMGY